MFSSARGLCSGLFLYEYRVGHLGGEQPDQSAGDRAGLALAGVLLLSLTSIVDAGVAANQYNERHQPPSARGPTVTPFFMPSSELAPAIGPRGFDAGLSLAGRF
jgi:hypothetical protein